MTITLDSSGSVPHDPPAVAVSSSATGAVTIAGFASLGAGAIHAAAVGVHNEHREAVLVFVLAAAFQLAWGAWALTRSSPAVALLGGLGHTALIGGWALAKSSGIAFIAGLEEKEAVQFADAAAAALAALVVLGVLARFLDRRGPSGSSPLPVPVLALVGAVLAAVTIPAMAAAGGHAHAGHNDQIATAASPNGAPTPPADDGHGHSAAEEPPATVVSTPPTDQPDATDPPVPTPSDAAPTTMHGHADTPVSVPEAKAYDPSLPIDLGGTEGVSLQQQARAENLIATTLNILPKYSDYTKLPEQGWYSIGDGPTGYEHYVKWDSINDDTFLDPNEPESLVFTIDRSTGKKQLASAMYMMPTSYTLETVPDIGGPLTQWHIHNNLCYSGNPSENPRVQVIGLTSTDGTCAVGYKPEEAPMIHVWIIPHKCGPFSALEGVGAGQVKEGETTLCDSAHGSH